MLFDTHAHVNFNSFKEDAEETIKRSLEAGVWVNNVGTQFQTSKHAVELADKFAEGVFATIGLHPVHTYSQHLDEEETSFQTKEEKFDYNVYHQLSQNPKVVGIGECGLDYYRLPDDVFVHEKVKELQKEAFISQIRLAKEADKALVVHSRSTQGTDDACLDILDILKQEGMDKHRVVLHSYTGSPEVLKMFFGIGGYVSFNGIITFDKTGNMEKLVNSAPLERILVETDCPYLTPVPNRGKRNEPAFVRHTAEHLGKLKGISLEEMEKITTENAKKLFKLPFL